MAANQTLVEGAYKVAMANVKPYDPNLAKQAIKDIDAITDPIKEGLKTREERIKKEELEVKAKNEATNKLKDAQIKQFTSVADSLNKRLSSFDKGGQEAGMHQQIYDNTFDYLETLKSEFELYNTVGDEDSSENRKKRIEILGKLDAVKNSTTTFRSDILSISKLAGSADGGSQMSETMNPSHIAVMNEILNMDGDYSNVTQRWDLDKNAMFFDVTIPDDIFKTLPLEEQKLGQTRTWNSNDLKKNFKVKPTETLTALVENSGNSITNGGNWNAGDPGYDVQAGADTIAGIIGDDPNVVGDIFQTRLHGNATSYDTEGITSSGKWKKGSWANALEVHPDLNGEPYKLDPEVQNSVINDLIKNGKLKMEDVDTDGNGISTAEYEAVMNSQNKDLVIDVYVNPDNPLYNHENSVREFSMFRSLQDQAKFNENRPLIELNKVVTESLNPPG